MKHKIGSIYPEETQGGVRAMGADAPTITDWMSRMVREGNSTAAVNKACVCYAKLFNLKVEVAVALLTGEIEYTIDDDVICFDWPDTIRKEWE